MAIPTPTSVLTRLAVCEEAPDRCAIISDPPPYEVSQALQNAFNANTCGPSCRPQEDLNDSDNDLPPYDPVVPPYFPKTPIAPFLACIVRRPGWENGDLSLFMRDADTWAQDFDVLRAELRSWDLPEDPNAYVRTQLRDPAGWSGISENDVRWADSSFPPGIRNTVLSLRPNAQMSLFYNTEASSELMEAIRVTLGLGIYRKSVPYRPIRYYIPSSTPGRMSGYDASWILAALGPDLADALGNVLLPQQHYTQLVKALFLVQCRRKFVMDARSMIEERQGSIYWRWKRERRLWRLREGQTDDNKHGLVQWFTAWGSWAA